MVEYGRLLKVEGVMLGVFTAEPIWDALLTILEGEDMTDLYLPVPVWNNRVGQWEPIDFRHGQRVVMWPHGLDLAQLPLPNYHDGDRVQFVRDETCAREGVVRMVLLRGGTYGPLDRVEALIEQWYCSTESLRYIGP